MNKVQVSLLLLVALVTAKKDYSGYKVLQVTPENLLQLKALKKLEAKYDDVETVSFWNDVVDVQKPVSIQLAPEVQSNVIDQIQTKGIKSNIIIDDLQKLIDGERMSANQRNVGTFALDEYHDYNEMISYMTDLIHEHEGTKLKSMGQSIEGRDIYVFSIASGDKPAIVLECNLHAREWITGATCINLMSNLLTNKADKKLRDAYDWYFIPVANPDGHAYTWSDDRMWRKNRRKLGECDGVDLNRNFDANFGGPGSSSSKCSETYHGESAFSEPETKAERDFLNGLKDRLVAFWSFHSYGLWYLLPYCYSYQKPNNFNQMYNVAKASSEAVKNTHGMEFTVGECASTLYIASGGAHDWVLDALSPPFAATMELRDQGEYGFLLPQDQIIPVFEEVWNGLKTAIEVMEQTA